MTITEKVSYLKGLADGLELAKEPSKEGKLISSIIDILEDVGLAIEDLEATSEALGEELDAVSDDLSDVEEMVFDEIEDEDDENCCCCGDGDCDCDEDDDFFEIACPNCNEDLVIDGEILESGEVTCPSCGEKFSMEFTEEEK